MPSLVAANIVTPPPCCDCPCFCSRSATTQVSSRLQILRLDYTMLAYTAAIRTALPL